MRSLGRAALAGASGGLGFLLLGCGTGAPNCTGGGLVLQVQPAAATADHKADAPGNQVHFAGTATYTAPAGCAVPALAVLEYATWTNPDPVNIQISSASDPTNGTAVCVGPTAGAVTLRGAFAPGPPTTTTTLKTVTLTCR